MFTLEFFFFAKQKTFPSASPRVEEKPVASCWPFILLFSLLCAVVFSHSIARDCPFLFYMMMRILLRNFKCLRLKVLASNGPSSPGRCMNLRVLGKKRNTFIYVSSTSHPGRNPPQGSRPQSHLRASQMRRICFHIQSISFR